MLEKQRCFWLSTFLLLAVLATVQIASIRLESETLDESYHMAAGYSYLLTGDYQLSPEHPPLGRILCALPLLWLQPHLPLEDQSWKRKDAYAFGKTFLYFNRVSVDTLLLSSRLVTIALTLLLGLAIATLTRQFFGSTAAAFALFLLVFDPNVVAHGRYVTTDLAVTLAIFLACAWWSRYLVSRRPRHVALSGIALGLALATKFSAVLLLPIILLLWVFAWIRTKMRPPVLLPLMMLLLAFVLLFAVYRFEIGAPAAVTKTHRTELLARHPRLANIPLPMVSFFRGLYIVNDHNVKGSNGITKTGPEYLLGQVSLTGWWYYFPVAFLVKTPTALLLLLVLSIVCAIRSMAKMPDQLRAACAFLIPPAFYFLVSMSSTINIGIRHILPIYPFLFVWVGAVLMAKALPRWCRATTVVLACLLVVESLNAFPNYLSFFNLFCGGSNQGHRYLLDSNLDWSQDIKKLKTYVTSRGIGAICALGLDELALNYYGIPHREITGASEADIRATNCVLAISANELFMNDTLRWLRQERTLDMVAHSIYLYDLRLSK
jgi:4-amino-4-deoxy-L-arabinose transferase-like glycosyltransferase